MKKFIILILCTFFVLCSCAEAIQPDDYLKTLRTPYSANVTVSEDGTDYTVRIVLQQDGSLNIVFAEPAMLWGMGYSFEGDDSFLIYNDMSIELDSEELSSNVSSGVFRWKSIISGNSEYSLVKSSLNGKSAVLLTNGECDIYFDSKTKLPLMFKTDKTTITVNEWEIKNANNDMQTQNVLTD
ncbi:MAG: hypothetical protein IKT65_05825 [Clostridia bacterium]|nr:hypothetical protein [Clostridia bacterium]